MSAPVKEAPAKGAAAAAADAYYQLAEKIFVGLAARVYGTLAGTDQRKPDPKALAAYSFKLAEAFEQAYRETDRKKAELEVANKAAVKLDDVDLSSVFQSATKP
jgi:hypothetical protein